MQSTLKRIEEPRFEDDPHDAPTVAPDIVPTAWVDRGPQRPANDATSRERLFAEIQNAHEATVPAVDTTFRASDANERKDESAGRIWMKRALTAFMFALVSALAAAAWKHHGDAATQTVTSWMPSSNASTVSESSATTEQAEATPAAAAVEQRDVASPQPAAASSGAPDTEQQIQSMARDLAAMGQQIVELKTSIEQLKASQQAMTGTPASAERAPTPKPPPRTSALPTRPTSPQPLSPRHVMPAAVPPPSPAAVPPPPYQPQAAVQPNGEPVMRPPAPLPLLPDRQ